MDLTFEMIMNIIKDKLYKYFERGFDDRELIILLPIQTFNQIAYELSREMVVICENPLEYKMTKSYLCGIEVKEVRGLNEIYVSLK